MSCLTVRHTAAADRPPLTFDLEPSSRWLSLSLRFLHRCRNSLAKCSWIVKYCSSVWPISCRVFCEFIQTITRLASLATSRVTGSPFASIQNCHRSFHWDFKVSEVQPSGLVGTDWHSKGVLLFVEGVRINQWAFCPHSGFFPTAFFFSTFTIWVRRLSGYLSVTTNPIHVQSLTHNLSFSYQRLWRWTGEHWFIGSRFVKNWKLTL